MNMKVIGGAFCAPTPALISRSSHGYEVCSTFCMLESFFYCIKYQIPMNEAIKLSVLLHIYLIQGLHLHSQISFHSIRQTKYKKRLFSSWESLLVNAISLQSVLYKWCLWTSESSDLLLMYCYLVAFRYHNSNYLKTGVHRWWHVQSQILAASNCWSNMDLTWHESLSSVF